MGPGMRWDTHRSPLLMQHALTSCLMHPCRPCVLPAQWEMYRNCPPWVKKPQGGYHHNRNFGKFAVETPLVFQRLCRRCLDPGPRNRPTFKEVSWAQRN